MLQLTLQGSPGGGTLTQSLGRGLQAPGSPAAVGGLPARPTCPPKSSRPSSWLHIFLEHQPLCSRFDHFLPGDFYDPSLKGGAVFLCYAEHTHTGFGKREW